MLPINKKLLFGSQQHLIFVFKVVISVKKVKKVPQRYVRFHNSALSQTANIVVSGCREIYSPGIKVN